MLQLLRAADENSRRSQKDAEVWKWGGWPTPEISRRSHTYGQPPYFTGTHAKPCNISPSDVDTFELGFGLPLSDTLRWCLFC